MDQKHTDMLKQGGHRFQVFPCHLSHSCMFQRFYLKKKKEKKIRQQKQKPELDGAHWRLLYCLLFCNADWGCHVEKGYYSFLKLLKNPAGSLKNVWMPSVFASSLFRHKRYTQSLPQCDKAIIKKRSILVCSVIFVHPLFLHSFWQRPKHIRVFALWNGMMHFTVWSQRKKSFILQSACSSYTNSTEICWTTFEIILCMYVYLYMCVSVLSASTHSSEVECWDTSIALLGS